MGNASGVFQADAVRVFSIACLLRPHCELTRRTIPQAAVGPLLVIVGAPIANLSPRVKQVLKPTHPQAFVSQLPMKALYLRILRRLARLNVPQLDLPLQCPGQKVTTGQLRPVVTANRLRLESVAR